MQVQKALQNAILLQYLGDLQSSCFQSRKDIVIPPLITNAKVLKSAGGQHASPIAGKHTNVYFRGKLEFNGDATRPGYSRGIRVLLNTMFGTRKGFSINEGHSPVYLQEMQDAKLCLAPPGMNTRRAFYWCVCMCARLRSVNAACAVRQTLLYVCARAVRGLGLLLIVFCSILLVYTF